MKFGVSYRYSRPYSKDRQFVDGLPNYFANVPVRGRMLLLDAGINTPKVVRAPDGSRRPAILISSSPHKRGARENPWHDEFDSDRGRVIYYGDNKSSLTAADQAKGNAVVLEQFPLHTSPDPKVRARAVPFILFERVSAGGRRKGQVQFHGVGVLTGITLVTQFHPANGDYFPNYRFEFCVLSLAEDQEQFDWSWVDARRNHHLPLSDTLAAAPKSWRKWVTSGHGALERVRRNVLKATILKSITQRPARGSAAEKTLESVYRRYTVDRQSFENVASYITAQHLRQDLTKYKEGWVTPRGTDHGVDFVGRIELGTGLGATSLVLLGQAKCERPSTPTGGNHIARTVARLRRGWLGAYVTTSFFSEAVQREVAEDEYPILLINGARIVELLELSKVAAGHRTVDLLLDALDKRYPRMLSARPPESVLVDVGIGEGAELPDRFSVGEFSPVYTYGTAEVRHRNVADVESSQYASGKKRKKPHNMRAPQ